MTGATRAVDGLEVVEGLAVTTQHWDRQSDVLTGATRAVDGLETVEGRGGPCVELEAAASPPFVSVVVGDEPTAQRMFTTSTVNHLHV